MISGKIRMINISTILLGTQMQYFLFCHIFAFRAKSILKLAQCLPIRLWILLIRLSLDFPSQAPLQTATQK